MKGQKMLKVCGILMVIFGALALLISILGVLGVGLLAAASEESLGMAATLMLIVGILGCALELVTGIVGIKASSSPSVPKIKASLILGLLVFLLSLASTIYNLVSVEITGVAIISAIIGLIIPVLYLVAIFKFKNALVALMTAE
ncbi:MAG: hypothetical protein RR147_01890 [Oscillospiraceae bacterium]